MIFLNTPVLSKAAETGMGFCFALIVTLVMLACFVFAGCRDEHMSTQRRCTLSRLGVKLLLMIIPTSLIGSYSAYFTMTVIAAVVLFGLFLTLKGIVRSIGTCKVQKSSL